ncbi:hypothetical protein LWI28_021464 [Acer negundo]|uniref:Uncharacterized protein n=1 Tax=Acer negundo TaxID=4023 RepID=A0AAD5P7M7_ACENE|nr:hypothetical protein LWI28_021464 [Acer negundo]
MGESVNKYFARTLAVVNKLRVNKGMIDDVVVIKKILRSMTPKFDYVVCSIEESNDLDVLTIDELQSSLLVNEQQPVEAARSGNESDTGEHNNTEESETDGSSNESNEGNLSGEDHSLEAREQRPRRQPTWMKDYVGDDGRRSDCDEGSDWEICRVARAIARSSTHKLRTNQPPVLSLRFEKWRQTNIFEWSVTIIGPSDTIWS